MNLTRHRTPLVLMCPAWKHWGKVKTVTEPVLILHSRGDEVIPFRHSEELIETSRLSSDRLIEVGLNHRLADKEALDSMVRACESFM